MDRTNRITKFGLSNFKSFHYLEDIELRPLTVLVGANSAGKSSLLQSLLLLKQTTEADRFSGVLKFDGEWTHLGNYANVISNFDTIRKLEYRFTVQQALPLSSDIGIARAMFKSIFPKTRITKQQLSQHLIIKSDVVMNFSSQGEGASAKIESFTIISKVPNIMTDEQASVFSTSDNGKHLTLKNMYSILGSVNDPTEPTEVNFNKFWPKDIVYERGYQYNDGDLKSMRQIYSLHFFRSITGSLRLLEQCLSDRLEYLGPLRADPRSFYPIEETSDVGPRGESTIPYLLSHQNDIVQYVPSPMHGVQEATLLDATNYWLKAMKVTDCLSINPVEAIGYVAAIQSRSAATKSVNLSQVGFGVGQLLPVLVSGLKGPDNSTLLLEQPEIHLHPRLQAMLAEFLLCTAQVGKTVIVETHSDHLINRLRRCIAEDETGTLADMVSILFVHPGTEENPSSYVEALEIDGTGNIVNWPPDFLSESANESLAILRAAQQKTFAAKP